MNQEGENCTSRTVSLLQTVKHVSYVSNWPGWGQSEWHPPSLFCCRQGTKKYHVGPGPIDRNRVSFLFLKTHSSFSILFSFFFFFFFFVVPGPVLKIDV